MFSDSWLPNLFAKAFAPIPDIPIYQWAEDGADPSQKVAPFRLRKSPEPTYRASSKPWAKLVGDLVRKPWFDGRRIRRYGAKKASQSGYTEAAILNAIRWFAKFSPRNCIVSLDSQKEVDNVRARLLPTLEDLGESIFTSDKDDLRKFKLTLAMMDIWFDGSFSAGGFANKFAPFVANDEVDLYGEISDEGNTIENYWTRAKEGDEDSFQVVLSKPAMKDGPIDSFFQLGDQQEWNVPCPHHGCHEQQPFEWERVTFAHCKDLTTVRFIHFDGEFFEPTAAR